MAALIWFDNRYCTKSRWPGVVPQSNELHKIKLYNIAYFLQSYNIDNVDDDDNLDANEDIDDVDNVDMLSA